MKAAVVSQTGVEIREVPAPVPGRNHVLVRVRACGLNRADLGVAAGHMHGTIGGPGTIVGMEFAGEALELALRSTNRSSYFNALPTNEETALFVGSSSGNHYSGKLPGDGDYTVRVYLMRKAARRGAQPRAASR